MFELFETTALIKLLVTKQLPGIRRHQMDAQTSQALCFALISVFHIDDLQSLIDFVCESLYEGWMVNMLFREVASFDE